MQHDCIRFKTKVKCKIPYKSEYKEYEDNGFLLLPENYSENGKPVRLVISCHGAGGTVTTDDSQIEHQTMTKYLLLNGFAVMDVGGLPEEFADEFGINIFQNIGAPFAVDSYVAGYEYCTSNFNLYKEVYVHGGSMGGISSTNLVLSNRIPVIAQSGFCPVLDAYNEIFLHPWSGGLPKTALGLIYSLEKDKNGDFIYDEQKVGRFNPFKNPKTDRYPVSVKFWHSADDPIVSPEITEKFVKKVNAGGGHAELILLPGGEHEPQDYGGYVASPLGLTEYIKNGKTEKLKITEAIEGVFRFISSFESGLED